MHSNEEDGAKLQFLEEQSIQALKDLASAAVEVNDEGLRLCQRQEDNQARRISIDQGLRAEAHGEPNPSSSDISKLTIILSMGGLLLRRCWQKSSKMKSLKFRHEYIVLRPGCIEFLKDLLCNFNVGIWSAAYDTQVVDIIKILEKEAKEKLPFFMIWGQTKCQPCEESRVVRPDNPGVEALFKPLMLASTKFGIDSRRMLLIDDAPLKGCVNPKGTCVFPPSFDVDKEDNVLLDEVLPYIKALHHVNDIRNVVSSSSYGQAPIVPGHELYNRVHKVVAEWEDQNLAWIAKTHLTSRLPQVSYPFCEEKGAASSTNGMSTRSQDKRLGTLDHEKMRLLKSIKSISTLKGVEAILLAQKLGYKEPVIKAYEAKRYIQNLKAQFNLK